MNNLAFFLRDGNLERYEPGTDLDSSSNARRIFVSEITKRTTFSRVKIIRAFLSVGIARLCVAWVVLHAFAWVNRKTDERKREETTIFEMPGVLTLPHLRCFFFSLFSDFSALIFSHCLYDAFL